MGYVIWFTGLSGSGKTTVANSVYYKLQNNYIYTPKVELLDGDEVRANLSKELGFSKKDRDTNVRRIGYVANLLARNNVFVLVSVISPYRDIRNELKKTCTNFIEVYCDSSLEECKKRDPKGLYKKAIAGEIKNFTGIDDPYEEPTCPNIHLHTDKESIAESSERVMNYFNSNSTFFQW
jgi:adenylylsulfate kinase